MGIVRPITRPVTRPVVSYPTRMSDEARIAANALVFPVPDDLTNMTEGRDGSGGSPDPGDPIGRIENRGTQGGYITVQADNQRPILRNWPVTGKRGLTANNTFDNAVIGVVGSGGAFPAAWSIFAPGGLTTEVLGTGVEGDLDYIDVRISGTSTGTYYVLCWMDASAGGGSTASVAGERYTQQMSTKLISGSIANVDTAIHRFDLEGANSAGGPISLTSELIQTDFTHTTTAAGGGTLYPGFALTMASGAAIDISIRFAGLQCETGTQATVFQKVINEDWVEEAGVPAVYSPNYDGVDDGLQFNFPGGAGPSDCSIFCVPDRLDTDNGGLFSRVNGGGFIGAMDGSTITDHHTGAGAITTFVDSQQLADERRNTLKTAIGTNQKRLVEFRNADLSAWPDMMIADIFSAPYEFEGQLIGPIIVETSKLTNSLRRTIETYLKRQAGIQ